MSQWIVAKHSPESSTRIFSITDLKCDTYADALYHVCRAFGVKFERELTHWHPDPRCIAFSNGNPDDPIYAIHYPC